jgi:hypothetical protein
MFLLRKMENVLKTSSLEECFESFQEIFEFLK